MNGCHIKYELDIITLGSYDVFIGMDWIELHHAILHCHNKSMMCLDEDGKIIQVKGIPRPVLVIQISTIQMKKCLENGYQLYVIHVEELSTDMEPCIEEILVLQKFQGVFQKVPRLPPK